MQHKHKTLISFVVMMISLSIFSTTFADDGKGKGKPNNPGDSGVLPNGDLAPDYRQQYPSSGQDIIVRENVSPSLTGATAVSCEAISLNREVYWIYSGTIVDATARSYVRAGDSPSYPCDLDRVGARARYWVRGYLKGDTNMLYSTNSADATAQTRSNAGGIGSRLARGNHEFKDGLWSYAYVTEISR